jgi:DNA-binding CsgD family transcriptional regulator
MRRPIVNNSRPGQLVYDPFLGSGTSLIAAEMTGRTCIGLEISPGLCRCHPAPLARLHRSHRDPSSFGAILQRACRQSGPGSITGRRCLENSTGRRNIEADGENCALIILDNLSSLCSTEHSENDAESWSTMQPWLLKLRRQGKAVLLVHHTGKPNDKGRTKQRGTSKREDILNTSILLERRPGMGNTTFTWEFTKSRGFVPEASFTVDIGNGGQLARLDPREAKRERDDRVLFLRDAGYTYKEIADEMHIGEQTISKIIKGGQERREAKAA